MLILDHDHIRIAYGAEWVAIKTIGDTKPEARRIARAHRATVCTVIEPRMSGGQPVAGVGKAKLKAKQPTYTAAEVLAAGMDSGEKEGAYLALVGDGQYAFVGILEGGPSPGFDVVGSAEEVLAAASEFAKSFVSGAPLFVHVSVTENTPSDIKQFLRDHQSVVSVVDALPGLERDLEQLSPLAPLGSDRALLLAGVGTMGLLALGGAWYGWSWYHEQTNLAERRARESQAALNLYKASVDAGFNSLAVDQSATAGEAVWRFVENLKIQRAGWTVEQITCSGGTCTLNYQQAPRQGTFTTLSKTVQQPESPEMKVSALNVAAIKIPLPDWDKVPKLQLPMLTDIQPQLAVEFGTQGQVMEFAGLSVTFGNLTPLGDDAPLRQAGVSAGAVPRYSYGTWQIAGPADTFVAAMRRLPAQSTLSQVVYSVTRDGVKFDANGRYFTKR